MSQPPVLHEDEARQSGVQAGKLRRLFNSRPTMLLMLFCVTGFLGIPFLWKSESFSKAEKIFWSLIVTAYTSMLLYGTGAILLWSFRSISEALGW